MTLENLKTQLLQDFDITIKVNLQMKNISI